jgi:hypothetical protein
MSIAHDRAKWLDHPNVGSELFQGIEERGHQRNHQEDAEQLLRGYQAHIEDAAQRIDRTAGPGQNHQERADDRRDDDIGSHDHRQHNDRHAGEIDPVGCAQARGCFHIRVSFAFRLLV